MGIFRAYRSATGRFVTSIVAKTWDEAADILARRFGLPSHANADYLTRGRFRITGKRPARRAQTDVNTLLLIALLTREDEGTTGHMVRHALYSILGRVSHNEVLAFIDYYTQDSEDEDERMHWLQEILPLVDAMRLDDLEERLRDVGLGDVGYEVSIRTRWKDMPARIARLKADLEARKGAEPAAPRKKDFDAAIWAADEVLAGRRGWEVRDG